MSIKKTAKRARGINSINEPREGADSEQGVGEPESVDESNFDSELQYEGYQDIEDYDNDFLNANPEKEASPDKELNIVEREDASKVSSASEEDLLDPQGNREAAS